MKRMLLATLFFFPALSLTVAAREAKGGDKPKEKVKEKPDKLKEDKEAPISWRERLVPGPAVLLRVKREPGKFLIYDGSLFRSQTGVNSYTESDSFYLTVLCADKREENIGGKARTLDLLALRRTFTEREREEKLENGKLIKRALENSEDLISIGPNYEIVGALRCHAFDEQNNPAYKTESLILLKDGRQVRGTILTQTAEAIITDTLQIPLADVVKTTLIPQPHICIEETPNYLFPPFSEQKKAPGDTWRFKVPIIVPLKQGNPPQVLPTQFSATVTARLCEVKAVGNGQVAIIEYRVSGVFDTKGEEFSGRFPEAFHEDNRIVHKLAGEGVLHLELEKGRILEKSEAFTFSLYAESKMAQGADKAPKQVENQIEINSRYQIKLMPPGTKMKNGKAIPNYD